MYDVVNATLHRGTEQAPHNTHFGQEPKYCNTIQLTQVSESGACKAEHSVERTISYIPPKGKKCTGP